MKLIEFIEIENFKNFGDKIRIDLDQPTVLIGPNNAGKTSVLQAIALWSIAVKTWQSKSTEKKGNIRNRRGLNRLNIVWLPVKKTRYFWHNTKTRIANKDISLNITLSVLYKGEYRPLTMEMRSGGEELVYCQPDANSISDRDFISFAAEIKIGLLYAMSGLAKDEMLLQENAINSLLGQGQTAQVLRNLCYHLRNKSESDWEKVKEYIKKFFNVKLSDPIYDPDPNSQGTIELNYSQINTKVRLDIALAGRGFQQILLILTYLYLNKNSLFLIDEPDAHLEILRQKQIYLLLRHIASENHSQVIIATHSEAVFDVSLNNNLTLIWNGKAENLAKNKKIQDTLRYFGTEHYIRAKEMGYVLYVEGRTDIDMLEQFAKLLNHPTKELWSDRVNSYFLQDNFPAKNLDSELAQAEEGEGRKPIEHFNTLRSMLPSLIGLALHDRDGNTNKKDKQIIGLTELFWHRYELENYFITPEVLIEYTLKNVADNNLGDLGMMSAKTDIDEILSELILEKLFKHDHSNFQIYTDANKATQILLWQQSTQSLKLSEFAEEFFRRFAQKTRTPMLIVKGNLYELISYLDPKSVDIEITQKLDEIGRLFAEAAVNVAPPKEEN